MCRLFSQLSCSVKNLLCWFLLLLTNRSLSSAISPSHSELSLASGAMYSLHYPQSTAKAQNKKRKVIVLNNWRIHLLFSHYISFCTNWFQRDHRTRLQTMAYLVKIPSLHKFWPYCFCQEPLDYPILPTGKQSSILLKKKLNQTK